MAKVCIIGGGFIGRFYAEALHGQRGRDRVSVVYARKEETAIRFATDYSIPHYTTSMEEAIAQTTGSATAALTRSLVCTPS